jgi:beta-xylosidase
MVSAIMLWNEPNNLSHWDFEMDPEWKQFGQMIREASKLIKNLRPELKLVLGGISPIDPDFVKLMAYDKALDYLDAVGVHGFPLDWNHWNINQWPEKIRDIQRVTHLPVWVTEVGASSFGADEVQVFGLKRTGELLKGMVENIFWYSLLDLPPDWPATTRHKEAEGSSYYRHFYLGLIRADGSCKPAFEYFDPQMGICQWFHFEDARLESAIEWLKKLKVKKLRTGFSWADWHRPESEKWFDRQMSKLEDFDVTVTFCFTPPSIGQRPDHTSPPNDIKEFSNFSKQVIERYIK